MAMEVVLDGSIWAPRKVLARLIDAGSANAAQAGTAAAAANVAVEASMTPREREVLHLLMDGRSNRDIAGAMGIDEVTVKAHLGRMLRKTRSANRVELTLRAMEERTSKHQL
jgi:DNA-binding CsgD family transcriptional regulator